MSNSEYKQLYEAAQVGLWRTSIKDGTFLHANEATVAILGFEDFDELAKHSVAGMYDLADRIRLLKALQEFGEVNDFQLSMRQKDGKAIRVRLSAKLYADQDCIEGTLRDVSYIQIANDAAILPHLEKVSLIKQSIIQKIEENAQEPQLCRNSAKSA